MFRAAQLSSAARRSSRHLVDLPCELITPRSDEPALAWATDLSPDGAWLESAAGPLACGDSLIVCFRPGVWWQAREIIAFAEIARISDGRREEDDGAGMGISFVDLTPGERFALRCWLRPRPERPPARRAGVHRRGTEVCARVELPGLFSEHPFASRVS